MAPALDRMGIDWPIALDGGWPRPRRGDDDEIPYSEHPTRVHRTGPEGEFAATARRSPVSGIGNRELIGQAHRANVP